jgi:GT2 family glycosyltransferase
VLRRGGSAARRALIRRLVGQHLRRADGLPYEALAVADVDLDTCLVTAQPPSTPFQRTPEGVHAVVWHHGEPIGEVIREGPPEAVLPTLPEVARRTLTAELRDQRVRDVLAAPAGRGAHGRRWSPAATAPDVTVAVCTRDRPDDLRRCLTAIEALTGRVTEVLVVDNASRDVRSREVAAQFDFVRYVWEPRKGLDWARNRALLEATTAVVAFADDDVLVHPGWVDGLLRAFTEEPAAVLVTGLVVPAELATAPQVLFEVEGGFGRGYRRLYFSAAVRDGEVASARHATIGGAGTGANMAVRRVQALALGGFDPALDVGTPTGGCGDLEFYFRVVAAGHLLVYEPTAVVRHRHRTTMEGLVRQRRGDGTGSYSWMLGAGRRYGPVQFLGFLRFAVWWGYLHHLRGNLAQLLLPEALRSPTRPANTRGAVDAVVGRYYRRARRQAEEQAALHPDQPTAPDLVHPRWRRRTARHRTPVVTVDLSSSGLPDRDGALLYAGSSRRVTVRLLEEDRPPVRLRIRTSGSGLSAARLRWEAAAHLEGASRVPGPAGRR